MAATLFYASLLSADIDRLFAFYQDVFGFTEIVSHRAPIHRALDAGGCAIGFNALPAYDLLGLERGADERRDRVYLTFELDGRAEVDATFHRALALGAVPVRKPCDTGYGWYQAVLRDPDDNAFRVNSIKAD